MFQASVDVSDLQTAICVPIFSNRDERYPSGQLVSRLQRWYNSKKTGVENLKKKNVIASIIALSLLLMSGQALNPGLARLMAEYGVSESTVMLLATIPPLAVIPGTFTGSFLLRRFTKKAVGIAAAILITVCGTIPIFIDNFAAVLATRFFVGIGLGFLNCVVPSLPSEYYSPGDMRETATGIHGDFAGGGGLIFS